MNTDEAPAIDTTDEQPEYLGTATYDPADSKIRFTAYARLSKPDYQRARDAGFIWAPKQQIFVAPAWSPEREDLMLEWCGEIGDEDTTLVDRAEDRADRFDGYQERRADDAERARAGVAAIADNIPLGQPILVSHHSEKHARKDAERIENGMRKAVRMWETAQYWERRAKGALQHARYKELPAVRARRIKTLEADQRKWQRSHDEATERLTIWRRCDLTLAEALAVSSQGSIHRCFPLADYPRDPPASQYEGDVSLWGAMTDGIITAQQAQQLVVPHYERALARYERWIQHLGFRLTYERAMLDEGGGLVGERFEIKPGGKVLSRSTWYIVKKVNRQAGRINSVSVFGYFSTLGIEDVTDYQPPAEGAAVAVAAATKLPPLVNYPSEGFRSMLKADYDRKAKFTDVVCIRKVDASEKYGAHRCRQAPKEGGGAWALVGVYLTDEKVKAPPPPTGAPPPPKFTRERVVASCAPAPSAPTVDPGADFRAMKESLRAGVQVAVVPQLFVTPAALAVDVVARLDVRGQTVLEPSAGMGALALECVRQGAAGVECFDISPACVQALRTHPELTAAPSRVIEADFLARLTPAPEDRFQAVAMNPPFTHGADAQHVSHAYQHWLAPGGRLVAIMSHGVTFRSDKATTAFRALVDAYGTIEELPEGSFEASGTGVRTVVVVLDKPAL